MARSIASRTFRIVLSSTLIALGVSLTFSWWALEALEYTILEAEKRTEIEYFEKYGDKERPMRVSTAQMTSVYQPNSDDTPEDLPVIFQGVPVPFQGEIDAFGTEYTVITHTFAEGKFYYAKNMRLFEDNEEKFESITFILAGAVFIIAFALAALASRNISRPVVRLTTQLKKMNPETSDTKISIDYKDSELQEIAQAMNKFLQGLNESVTRERSLISMASHELKTPISVILGAARVIESRGRLNSDDLVTLNRIITASQEMSANIHALLNLAKRSKITTTEVIYWSELFLSIHQDYYFQNPHLADRLLMQYSNDTDKIKTDQVLAKMLLHNLISNALNYTHGKVIVNMKNSILTVSDEGISTLTDQMQSQWQTSGLGLYIVDLICRQLQWHYKIVPNQNGTCIKIYCNNFRL